MERTQGAPSSRALIDPNDVHKCSRNEEIAGLGVGFEDLAELHANQPGQARLR